MNIAERLGGKQNRLYYMVKKRLYNIVGTNHILTQVIRVKNTVAEQLLRNGIFFFQYFAYII